VSRVFADPVRISKSAPPTLVSLGVGVGQDSSFKSVVDRRLLEREIQTSGSAALTIKSWQRTAAGRIPGSS
jgi:hypothetical protein